jgi:hypothetical protein
MKIYASPTITRPSIQHGSYENLVSQKFLQEIFLFLVFCAARILQYRIGERDRIRNIIFGLILLA